MPGTFIWRPSYGFGGGPTFSTIHHKSFGGVTTRILREEEERKKWVVKLNNRSVEERAAILEFFRANKGSWDTFIIPDYSAMPDAETAEGLPSVVARFATDEFTMTHDYFDGTSWPDLLIVEDDS